MNTSNTNMDETYKRLQEILPDYVFNRASGEEIEFFERHIGNYPDLNDEISNVREVFSKVDEMEFDKIISQKSRNLSIKVNSRIQAKDKRQRQHQLVYKYLIPTFGMAVLLVLIFSNVNLFKTGENKTENASEYSVLSPKDVTIILSKPDEESFVQVTDELSKVITNLNSYVPQSNETNVENVWSDFLASTLVGEEVKNISLIPDLNQFRFDMSKELKNITETDLQDIMKEFENVDFNS